MGEKKPRRRQKLSLNQLDLMLSDLMVRIDERLQQDVPIETVKDMAHLVVQLTGQLHKIKNQVVLEKRVMSLEKLLQEQIDGAK